MAKLLKDDAGVPIPQIMLDDGNFAPAKGAATGAMRVTGESPVGDVGGSPIKIGGMVLDTTAPPPAVEAGRVVAAAFDNRGRSIVKMDTPPPLPVGAATSGKQDEIRARIDAAVNIIGTLATSARQDAIAAAVAAIKDDVAAIKSTIAQKVEEMVLLKKQTVSDTTKSFDIGNSSWATLGSVFLDVSNASEGSAVEVVVKDVFSFGDYEVLRKSVDHQGLSRAYFELRGQKTRVDVTVNGAADIAVYFVRFR